MKSIYQYVRTYLLLRFPPAYIKEGKLVTKYIIAGGTAALIQLSLFYLLIQLLGVSLYLLATSGAFVVALIVSFILQKFWTFGDNSLDRIKRQFTIYGTIALTNLFLNGVFMYVLVDRLRIWYMASQVMTMGVLAIFSFILNRKITFNSFKKDEGFNSDGSLST